MTISNVKYENPEQVNVSFTLDNANYSGVYEGTRNWTKYVQPFLEGGGVITLFEDTISLASYKTTAIKVNQKEAGARIALLFGTVEEGVIPNSSKLKNKVTNNIAEAVALIFKVAKGTNDAADDARLVVLGDLRDNVNEVISVENVASAAIDAVPETSELADDKDNVDDVEIEWPEIDD